MILEPDTLTKIELGIRGVVSDLIWQEGDEREDIDEDEAVAAADEAIDIMVGAIRGEDLG